VNCRHCRAKLRLEFLDLGTAPPSNAFLQAECLDQPEAWFPLRLMVCENCWLVQTQDFTDRESLFTDGYAYFSSYSTTWLEHSRRYVEAMVTRLGLNSQSCIVEVAANDGYLLQYVKQIGIPNYGIEPTKSTAAAARAKGLEIIGEFFGATLAERLASQGRSADLIVANNVLAHVPDINDFVRGVSVLLKPDGVATFEFPHLVEMVANNQFDTVYHEHYSYLSLTAVNRIFTSNGLSLFDAEQLSTHGGSLRVFAQRPEGRRAVIDRLTNLLMQERSLGVETADYYGSFQKFAESAKHGLLRFLLDAHQRGLKVAAYGAAAKGSTLLNYAGVRADLLPYVVDRNPLKINRFMPGGRIPIVGEAQLLKDQPDLILILPWNLREELVVQLSYAREWQCKFVTAIPSLAFV
jgi:2-polyprenyl-3-methyl-5-hydroxy-6-metoxy-1,4-benzoquinol methylase